MDFGDSTAEAEFRQRLRAWLATNNPGLPGSSTDDEYWAGMAAWHQSLFDGGFFGMSWPVAIGGQGLPSVYDVILDDELAAAGAPPRPRSEEHTSELQSLMRISYAVFCLKKKQ